MSALGFKARVGSLIHTWQSHTCNTFPEIYFWCNTCQPLSIQLRSQAILFHDQALVGHESGTSHAGPWTTSLFLTSGPFTLYFYHLVSRSNQGVQQRRFPTEGYNILESAESRLHGLRDRTTASNRTLCDSRQSRVIVHTLRKRGGDIPGAPLQMPMKCYKSDLLRFKKQSFKIQRCKNQNGAGFSRKKNVKNKTSLTECKFIATKYHHVSTIEI